MNDDRTGIGTYRHYKNQQLYRVLVISEWTGNLPLAVDALTPGTTPAPGARADTRLVTYIQLYDEGKVFTRPYSEFFYNILVNVDPSTYVRRFSYVGP